MFNDLALGLLVPAAAAAVLWPVLSRLGPPRSARHGAALLVTLGCWLGYHLLKLGPLDPASHWHWLPWALLLAMVAGGVSVADGVGWLERLVVLLAVSGVCALALAPTWENVAPARGVQIIAWSVMAAASAASLTALATRVPPRRLLGCLTLASACGAAVTVSSGNLRIGQVLVAGVGAWAGLCAVALWHRRPHTNSADDSAADPFGERLSRSLSGAGLTASVLLAGTLWAARVNSFSGVPEAAYWLAAAAPHALWLGRSPRRQWGAVTIVSGAAVILAVVYG